MKKYILSTVCCLLAIMSASAQLFPERGRIRAGNRAYEQQNWEEAMRRYGSGMALNPASWEAAANMGSTLYRMGQYGQADSLYSAIAKSPLLTPVQRARVYYDLGNARFQAKQYDQAIESYKNSLRLNPDDRQAKFNLAYAQKMLDNRQQNQNNNDRNQNNNDNQDQNQQDQNNSTDRNQNQQQQQQSRISREDAEKLLEAMQQQEDNTAQQMKAEQAEKSRGAKGKNW